MQVGDKVVRVDSLRPRLHIVIAVSGCGLFIALGGDRPEFAHNYRLATQADEARIEARAIRDGLQQEYFASCATMERLLGAAASTDAEVNAVVRDLAWALEHFVAVYRAYRKADARMRADAQVLPGSP